VRPTNLRTRVAATVAMLPVAVTIGCASVGRSELPAASGIAGTTVVDAGCPDTATTTRCPDRPIRAHLSLVEERSGAEVGAVDSAPDGSFRIDAAPGRYLLQAVGLAGAPLPEPPAAQPVEVRAGQVAAVVVRFDSGAR
jgi:hypothetical protein